MLVYAFLLSEVHIYFQALPTEKFYGTDYIYNQLCVYSVVKNHFCLVRILPVKEAVCITRV